MNKGFYIFGLQRSGTTFIENCITMNFDTRVLNGPGSWKHRYVIPSEYPSDADAPKIVVHKSPYTWLESIIFRGSADMLETHGKTIAFQSALVEGDVLLGHDQICIQTLCAFYNRYSRLALARNDLINVRYEDFLVDDVSRPIFELGLKCSFDSKPTEAGKWEVPLPGSLFMSEGFSITDYDYYLEKKPVQFDEEVLSIINSIIYDEIFDFHKMERVGKPNG